MDWKATWFTSNTPDGFAQVHGSGGRWDASAMSWATKRRIELGVFTSADEAKAACATWLAGEAAGVATCGPVNVDADGAPVAP